MKHGFRVYDKEEKTYSDKPFSIDQLGICYVQDEDGYWEEIDEERFIVEQYIGFEDKYGTEICVGDIIKVDSDKLAIPSEDKTEASEVFYSKSKAAFVYRTWYGEILVGRHDTSVEIIGRVHHNRELLEENKESGD